MILCLTSIHFGLFFLSILAVTSGAVGAFSTATSGAAGAFTTATSGAGSVFSDATSGAAGLVTTISSGGSAIISTISSGASSVASTAPSQVDGAVGQNVVVNEKWTFAMAAAAGVAGLGVALL